MENTTAIQLLQMDGQILVDSRIIAKGFGIQHHNLMQNVYTYQPELEEFGQLLFQTEVEEKVKEGRGGNNPQKYALLNRNQIGVIISLSRNTPQVVRFKVDLFKAIDAMERELALTKRELEEIKRTLLEAELTISRLYQLRVSNADLYELSWPLGRHHRACDEIEQLVSSLRKRKGNPDNRIGKLEYTMKTYTQEVRALKKALDEEKQNYRDTQELLRQYHRIKNKLLPKY